MNAYAEIFYDTRFDSWNRHLYQAGVEIELAKRWCIEPYLARQNDSVSSSGNVNRVTLVLKYYHCSICFNSSESLIKETNPAGAEFVHSAHDFHLAFRRTRLTLRGIEHRA